MSGMVNRAASSRLTRVFQFEKAQRAFPLRGGIPEFRVHQPLNHAQESKGPDRAGKRTVPSTTTLSAFHPIANRPLRHDFAKQADR